MRRRDSASAFTLLELLVAIGLMTLLMAMVAVIFLRSSDLFRKNSGEQQIAVNQRAALDLLARDVAGCVPVESGSQRLTCWDVLGRDGDDGETVLANQSSPLPDGAADAIQFVSATSFRGASSTVHVTYCVDLSTDPEVMLDGGSPRGMRTGRRLMTLKRIVRRQAGNAWETDEADLCEYVLSFNIEALVDPDDDGPASPRFMQLGEGPLRSGPSFAPPGNPYRSAALGWWARYHDASGRSTGRIPPLTPSDPVLSSALHGLYPIGAPRNPPNAVRPPRAIRVTMRVVEGAAEARERLISRVIWLPTE